MLQTMGDDVLGEDMHIIGAAAPQLAMRGIARMPIMKPSWMGHATAQGVSKASEELDYLPFTVAPFVAAAAGFQTFSIQATAFPQRPFRGERLIASARLFLAAGGAPVDVSDIVFIDPAVYVGAVQVGSSQGQVALSTFAATAFGVRLSFPSAGQGTRVFIPLTGSGTFAIGDRIVIGLNVIGRAVR